MKEINYSLVLLTLSLCIGILCAPYLSLGITTSFILLALVIGVTTILHLVVKKSILFSIIAALLFIGIGIITNNTHNPKSRANHYTHFKCTSDSTTITFKIQEELKPNSFSSRYVAQVLQINSINAQGKLLINFPLDTTAILNTLPPTSLEIDDVYFAKSPINTIPKPKNPFQFDYANYMENQGVYGQAYLSPDAIVSLPANRKTLRGIAAKIRTGIQQKLYAYNFKPNEWAVINALLLGQRQELSPQLSKQYAEAGMIHILAVSGLHVGILLLLLQALLKPLGNYMTMRIVRTMIILITIWIFALIAGLTPSILRAATMFSFIQIGLLINRKSSGYNALLVSAFILLLINPSLIYQVGFQLSYLAVFFILWLQPVIYNLWIPPNLILKKLWSIASVTLAAQLGVLPLSMFYFHQFPGLFLVANLVVLPFLFIVLGLGILLLILASINALPEFFAEAYELIIYSLNQFISWIASFENLIIRNIHISVQSLILLFITILCFGLVLKTLKYRRLIAMGIACIFLIGQLIWEKKQNVEETLYVFHKNRETLLASKHSNALQIYLNDSLLEPHTDSRIMSLLQNTKIKDINTNALGNYLSFKNKSILILDSLGVYNVTSLNADYIILTNSPKINLNRLTQMHTKAILIADGSNYKSYVNKWRETCRKNNIPFHSTYEKGYYKID